MHYYELLYAYMYNGTYTHKSWVWYFEPSTPNLRDYVLQTHYLPLFGYADDMHICYPRTGQEQI